jgi:catechol 2,3-dioxygenase-like lactoylglutathione lyase family enzyme
MAQSAKFVCALITVSDIDRAKSFYEKVLGQKIKYDFGENVTFHGDFAIHQRSHFQKLIDQSPVAEKSNSFELYFEYDDLDSFVHGLKKNRVEFIHEPREQPWKQKVVRFYDPDFNIIEVGESMEFLCFRLSKENMSVQMISKAVGLPEDFVTESINKYLQ